MEQGGDRGSGRRRLESMSGDAQQLRKLAYCSLCLKHHVL